MATSDGALPRSEWDEELWTQTVGQRDVGPRYTQAELYHENSKYHRGLMAKEPLDTQAALAVPGRRLQQGIGLPTPAPELSQPLGRVLRQRRSVRNFRSGLMPLQTLADLLYYAAGATGTSQVEHQGRTIDRVMRAYPSGGALYPIDLFVIARQVEGLPVGAYCYDVNQHRLMVLPTSPSAAMNCPWTTPMHPGVVNMENAQVVLALVATFKRQQAKYGRRAYRFTLLEAGHMAQNLLLVASGLDLGAVTLGAFYDDELHGLFGLDGVEEAVLYLLPVGQP